MKLAKKTITSGLTQTALLWLVAILGIGAGVLGGVGVVFGPTLIEKFKPSGEEAVENVSESVKATKGVGFTMGTLSASDPVRTLKVTLQTGEGSDLEEKLDLHLGAGFPFRLYPVGGDTRDPAFAAYPQKSSLARGENIIAAGKSATFEFEATGAPGQDTLKTTSMLLKDLTVGDLDSIGFASQGLSEWQLKGYRIEVNGELFAANDSVKALPSTLLTESRNELASKTPATEQLLKEIAQLKSFIATGLASEADKADLVAKEAELEEEAAPLNRLAGEAAGYYPWWTETSEAFTATTSKPADAINEVEIQLIAGGGDRVGTRNPVYVKAGGKKFLLTSETDPLTDIESPQDFVLSSIDLEANPLSKAALQTIGIGVIGNEERFSSVPDRAKLQRVVISSGKDRLYDSERNTGDRRALEACWLIPSVHFDEEGELVENQEKPDEIFLWTSGMIVPEKALVGEVEKLPEPTPLVAPAPLDLSSATGDTSLGEVSNTPGVPEKDAKDLAKTLPGTTPTDATPPKLDLSGKTPPPPTGNITSTAPPLPGSAGSGGVSVTAPPRPITLGGSLPTLRPPPRGGLIQGGRGPGGFINTPLASTRFAGTPQGVFSPTGIANRSNGLVPGTFSNSSKRPPSSVFSPPRRKTVTTGGLTPTVFNTPTSKATPGLTSAEIAQIATAVANQLKPFSKPKPVPTPDPKKPNPVPTPPPAKPLIISNVRFDEATTAISNGGKATVRWDVSGDISSVSRYEISLMPVLPHKSGDPIASKTPVITSPASSSATSKTLGLIKIDASSVGGIAKEEWLNLYLQPVVTPMDAKGTPVGSSKSGSILPLFPRLEYSNNKNMVAALTWRGPRYDIDNNPQTSETFSFQIQKNIGNGMWRKLGKFRPEPGVSNVARTLVTTESSGLPLQFAPVEVARTGLATNTAIRTSGVSEETAVIVFEADLRLPHDLDKTKTSSDPGYRGYRVIAEMGFLGENLVSAATKSDAALVSAQVELSNPLDGSIRRDVVTWDLVKPVTPGMATPFFTYVTSSQIPISNSPSSSMTLFDVPIRFDQLDAMVAAGAVGAYEQAKPAAHFAAPPHGATDPVKPLQKIDLDLYSSVSTGSKKVKATVTIMVDTTRAPANQTLGIFGLRIVPDVYQ